MAKKKEITVDGALQASLNLYRDLQALESLFPNSKTVKRMFSYSTIIYQFLKKIKKNVLVFDHNLPTPEKVKEKKN